AMRLGEEAIIGTGVDPASSVEAGLVFVGYGLRIPENKYDDFAGLDTKGKIAVYMSGAPADLSSALAAHYQSRGQRWATPTSAAGGHPEARGHHRRRRDRESQAYGRSLGPHRIEPLSDEHAAFGSGHERNRGRADRDRLESRSRR